MRRIPVPLFMLAMEIFKKITMDGTPDAFWQHPLQFQDQKEVRKQAQGQDSSLTYEYQQSAPGNWLRHA